MFGLLADGKTTSETAHIMSDEFCYRFTKNMIIRRVRVYYDGVGQFLEQVKKDVPDFIIPEFVKKRYLRHKKYSISGKNLRL